MFERQRDLKIQRWCELLARRLGKRWPETVLRDARFNLSYGQFDGFVSNVYAAHLSHAVELWPHERLLLDRLIALLGMKQEIADLREYIAERSDGPRARHSSGWA